MAKITWDNSSTRFYELGIDRAVFFDLFNRASVWNGLTSVTENNDNIIESIGYIDGDRYVNQLNTADFSASITAYTYPDALLEHTGYADAGFTNQELKPFNLTYRTLVGNDISGNDLGYKIHLVYNAVAKMTDQEHVSFGGDITPTDFNWEVSSIPIKIPNLKPTSHIIIDSTMASNTAVAEIEKILYGTDLYEPRFPTIDELITIFAAYPAFTIIDHGDGSFTAIGRDDMVSLIEPTVFELSSSSVIMIDSETYQASTL